MGKSPKIPSEPANQHNSEMGSGLRVQKLDSAMNWIRDNCKKPIFSVLKYILKFGIPAVVIYCLGSSFYGNWLRCKLFDTQGCLPKLIIEAQTLDLNSSSKTFLEQRYTKINIPENIDSSAWTVITYLITLKNIGYESVGAVTFRADPLATSDTHEALLICYRVMSGPFTAAKIYEDTKKCFKIEGYHFQDSSERRVKEQSQLEFVVAYPSKVYNKTSGDVILLQAECESCQVTYIKKLLGKGEVEK